MRFWKVLSFFCLLVPFSLAMPILSQAPVNSDELIRQSTFVFVGTVEELNASTMKAVKASESTAVVRIDRIIDAPGATHDLVGKKITIQLRQSASLRPRQQATFYTKGWLLGSSMAVIEVGHSVETTGQAPAVRERVTVVRRQIADTQLQSEIATADAVVSGTVRAVYPAKIAHLGSEHDPDWYQAEIVVTATLMGKVAREAVTILFPHSDDVVWHDSPKFKEGERGVWLLHRNQVRLPQVEDQYTALKALDFQQQNQIERIQRLVKNTRDNSVPNNGPKS